MATQWGRRLGTVTGAYLGAYLGAVLCLGTARAQTAARVQPQPTAEDALAALVDHAAVIFAGEVYAIRTPEGTPSATAVRGGMPSSRADAVEVEFRVDMGIRGASIGNNYALRMPLKDWQQAPPFHLHERAVVFLRAPDAAGLSGPVEGDADIPSLDLGVIPVDAGGIADLSRLQRMVTRKRITSAAQLPQPGAGQTPRVTDVNAQGEGDLLLGTRQGEMPELRSGTIPFLALMRDVSVLNGAEGASRGR